MAPLAKLDLQQRSDAAGLFLIGLALRPQIVPIGALSSSIVADLGVSNAFIGLLTTIPVLTMGLCSPLGPAMVGILGVRRSLLLCVGVIALLGGARASSQGEAAIVATTVGIGIAIGAAGAITPIIARSSPPGSAGLLGGVATSGIVLGAIVSAGIVVPLADQLGGWRWPLLVFSLITFLSLPPLARLVPPAPIASGRLRPDWSVVRRPVVPALAVVFGLQAIIYWATSAWLPGALMERSWPVAPAAGMVALLNVAALAANLATILMSDRLGDRRHQIVASSVVIAAASGCLVLAPAFATVAVAALGLGLGAIFPLLLIATVDAAEDPAHAGSIAAVVLGAGYVIAALGPVVLGLLRDTSGAHQLGLVVIALVAAALLLTAITMPALSSRRLDYGEHS